MSIDICLVSPPQRAYNHYRPPLSLMLIASFLEKKGIKTEIIDPKSIEPVFGYIRDIVADKILHEISQFNPRIVGISCYTPEFNDVIKLATKIKEKKPDIKVIVGGVHPTLFPKDFFFKNSPIDFVIIGEGEITVYNLINAILKESKNLSDIYGIGYYNKTTGEYYQTKPRPLIEELDKMPLPAYNKIDMKYYTTPNPYAVRGLFLSSFYILAGRGCPMQCTFCVSAELSKIVESKKYLRLRSARNVVDEIDLLKRKYLIDAFYFIDDNFTLKRELVFGICDELISRKLNLLWGCSARINNLSEELIVKMKKAGCMQIDLGVESGSDAVLKRLKKGITIKQVKDIFKICHKIGMRTFANILINIPEETEEEIEDTLKLLDEIKPSVTSFNIFTPYPGTEIYKKSGLNLSSNEYSLTGETPLKLVEDPRFRFAKHSMNFNKFYAVNHKKYNSPFVFMSDYISTRYLSQIIKSHKKKDYFLQMGSLLKEFLKQVRIK